jgi:Domain of unknown function (DUF4279)
MTQIPGSAMSTTKSESNSPKAFASLRFKGDRLDPRRVTEILHADPTTAYRKGEIYKRSRGHEVRGRTGIWLLSSKGRVQSSDLNDHLRYLLTVLFPSNSSDRVNNLRDMLHDGHIEADVNCFWYGAPGTSSPMIPSNIRTALDQIPARIETDFHKP